MSTWLSTSEKLGKAYSLFVENTDEVAPRKELIEKGMSKEDGIDWSVIQKVR